MKRLPVVLAALLVAMAAVVVTTIGMVAAHQDDDIGIRMGPGMMYAGSSETPGWGNDSWGSMMGMMRAGWSASATEPEYLVEMIAHHREAVAAAHELGRSNRPQMRSLGQTIVETQSAQIEQMTTWLNQWYPDLSTTSDYKPMMRDMSGLTGDQLDRAFLQDMIGHHMIAAMLSQHLLGRGTDHSEIAGLAESIRNDQHTEIIQMQRWLQQWFGVDWHHGMGWGNGPGSTWLVPDMMSR